MEVKEQAMQLLIKRAAELFHKDPGELNENTSFADDLKAKSVNYVQIITVLEDEFEVEIPFMEFRRKKTFGEAAAYVEQLVEG